MIIVYLAGPMTGYPRWNFDAFHMAASKLRLKGFSVVNPAEIDEGLGFDPDAPVAEYSEKDRHEALRRDLRVILSHANAVVVLPGWQESKGASLEALVAQSIGLPVIELSTALEESSNE